MPISVPLDPNKIYSGEWENYAHSSDKNDPYWVEYDHDVNVDYNGDNLLDYNGNIVTYGHDGSFGVWEDSKARLWILLVTYFDFEYEGITDHDAIIVLDADNNWEYDSSIDYVIGYAFGNSNGGSYGDWKRTDPISGDYGGGAISKFILTVAMDYEGTKKDDYVVGSTVADKLKGDKGNDDLYGYRGDDKLYGESGKDYLYGNVVHQVVVVVPTNFMAAMITIHSMVVLVLTNFRWK